MTRQEIYDKVKNHLLAQGEMSESAGRCLYRGPEGRKCAAGVLIADEHYSPSLEGKTVLDYPCVNEALEKSGVSPSDLWFVRELQLIHDTYSPFWWREQLEAFAQKHGLQP